MATTNFFAHIANLPFEGCLNLTIRRDGEILTASLLLTNNAFGDNAKNSIPPLILKGTAKELCEGFFDAIAEPIAQTSALLINMEQYRKAQETAKQHSAMEKKKSEGTGKPATDAKPNKYEIAMAKVEALEAAGNYREAWMKVPPTSEFPDKAEELKSRRAGLSAKFSPDLFGAEQPATENVEPEIEDYATDDDNAEGLYDETER